MVFENKLENDKIGLFRLCYELCMLSASLPSSDYLPLKSHSNASWLDLIKHLPLLTLNSYFLRLSGVMPTLHILYLEK